MEIIVRSGNRRQRLRNRCVSLSQYVNKELRAKGEPNKVYNFKDWSHTESKSKELGNDRNGSKFKEFQEIRQEFKRKGDVL